MMIIISLLTCRRFARWFSSGYKKEKDVLVTSKTQLIS